MSIWTPPFFFGFTDGLVVAVTLGAAVALLLAMRRVAWRVKPSILAAALLWQAALTFVYCYVVAQDGGDIFLYYRVATTENLPWMDLYGLGTTFVAWVARLLVDLLGVGILPLSVIFGILGLVGKYLVASAMSHRCLVAYGQRANWWSYLILFMPGIAFWTSALGKDSLIMLGIGGVLFGAAKSGIGSKTAFLSWILVFHVRPHVGLAILASAIMATVLTSERVGWARRSAVVVGTAGALFLVMPIVNGFLGLEGAMGVDEYVSFASTRSEANMRGASAVNTDGYSSLEKGFTFMFRPLPYEVHSATALLASLENLFMLAVLISVLTKYVSIRSVKSLGWFEMLLGLYSLIMVVVISSVTSNMGLAFRQKTMVLVAVIPLIASVVASRKQQRRTRVARVKA